MFITALSHFSSVRVCFNPLSSALRALFSLWMGATAILISSVRYFFILMYVSFRILNSLAADVTFSLFCLIASHMGFRSVSTLAKTSPPTSSATLDSRSSNLFTVRVTLEANVSSTAGFLGTLVGGAFFLVVFFSASVISWIISSMNSFTA